MKTLADIPNLTGVKVLLRADFNVPIREGVVMDDFRIRAALPTIEYLRSHGARVVIASHLEVAEGEKATLEPVAAVLGKLGVSVTFVRDYRRAYEASEFLQDRKCLLLENLRTWPGEKQNDPKFTRELASLADIYVNDAFSVSHREHASIVGVPKLIPAYAGLQLEKEVRNLSLAFNPAHPFLFILGGAKFETKLPLLTKFLGIADSVFVGGAIANDLYREKGFEVGQSVVSDKGLDLSAIAAHPKLVMSADITNQDHVIKAVNQLVPSDRIMDIGPNGFDVLREKIAAAKFILWNGPVGWYEKGFTEPTIELARLVSEATSRGAMTIVGGGDTIAAIAALGSAEKFTFISTAGGAMLDFLAQGTLPGIEALN